MAKLASTCNDDTDRVASLLVLADALGQDGGVVEVIDHASPAVIRGLPIRGQECPRILAARLRAGADPGLILATEPLVVLREVARQKRLPDAAVQWLHARNDFAVDATLVAAGHLPATQLGAVLARLTAEFDDLDDQTRSDVRTATFHVDPVLAGRLLADPRTTSAVWGSLGWSARDLADGADLWSLSRRLLELHDTDPVAFLDAVGAFLGAPKRCPSIVDVTLRVLADNSCSLPSTTAARMRGIPGKFGSLVGTESQLRLALSEHPGAWWVPAPADNPCRALHPVFAANPHVNDADRCASAAVADINAIAPLLSSDAAPSVITAVVSRLVAEADGATTPVVFDRLQRLASTRCDAIGAIAVGIPSDPVMAHPLLNLVTGAPLCDRDTVRLIPWKALVAYPPSYVVAAEVIAVLTELNADGLAAFAALSGDHPEHRLGELVDLASAVAR